MQTISRAGALGLGWMAAAALAAPPVAELAMPSCVDGSPPMRLKASDERAVLDEADRARFHTASLQKYTMLRQGGLVPTQVLLLRRDRQWQYVTLARGGPAGLCFTASFTADVFDFTPAWLARYRPQAPPPID